ncbi:MAG TPA: ABC transporter substrate-binding protein [Terriglobales bacterium]
MLRLHKSKLWFILAVLLSSSSVLAQGSELRFALQSDPKSFNPLLVEDEASSYVRYLTGGVLIRLDRATQAFDPELAKSWKVTEGGKRITFQLREGISFSDGTPFTADDVAATMRALMDPNLHSSTGDDFRSGSGEVKTTVNGKYTVSILFPQPIAGVERLFDRVAIMPAKIAGITNSPDLTKAVLGPFVIAEQHPGSYILLKRNPHYWKRDKSGKQLPYVDSIRLSIQQNREAELLSFRRNEAQLINNLMPDLFDRLKQENPAAARDLGPSLESEQMWFNQSPKSPLPDYKKAWFRSRNFRRAISSAINRPDLARIVYRGHANPGIGPITPANKFWFNHKLRAHPYDQKAALELLKQDGFQLDGQTLKDKDGHPVVFSLITNAGNRSRERMGSLIQQDLAQIGIKLNFVPLDFPSIIERITKSLDYEACLLGLTLVDLDPDTQMNVWLSSGDNHQWSPNQKTPETPWEAEIDRLMREQASALDRKKRKAAFDRVQEIVWDQAPFLYLVDKDALVAVSPSVQNANPVVLQPQTFWNAEYLSVK